jgi:hypothetical protein
MRCRRGLASVWGSSLKMARRGAWKRKPVVTHPIAVSLEETADLGRAGALSYISKTFWSSVRARPSGTYVYRGYAAARAAAGKEKEKETPRSTSTSRRGSAASMRKPEVEAVVEAARDKSFLNTSAVEEENLPVVSDVYSWS